MANAILTRSIRELARELQKSLKQFEVSKLEESLKKSDVSESLLQEITDDLRDCWEILPTHDHHTIYGCKLPRFGRIDVRITEAAELPEDIKHLRVFSQIYNDSYRGKTMLIPPVTNKCQWQRHVKCEIDNGSIAFIQVTGPKSDIPSDGEFDDMASIASVRQGCFSVPASIRGGLNTKLRSGFLSQAASGLLKALVEDNNEYIDYDESLRYGTSRGVERLGMDMCHCAELDLGDTVSMTASMQLDRGSLNIQMLSDYIQGSERSYAEHRGGELAKSS